jgi:hypothetical protein
MTDDHPAAPAPNSPNPAVPIDSTNALLTLNPGARVLWRSTDELQLELGDRAVVVRGLPRPAVRRLVGRSATVATNRFDRNPVTDHIIDPLHDQGLLIGPDGDSSLRAPRLAADLLALRVRHGAQAPVILRRRAEAAVSVHGTTRVATALGALLAAAGIGRVNVIGTGDVRLHQAVPGGVTAADEGRRFTAAANDALRRAAPECDTRAQPTDAIAEDADLVILAEAGPVDEQLRTALHSRGLVHLRVEHDADRGIVGPLVVPGWSSCLRCADLQRLDRDPAWSVLAVQLEAGGRRPQPADVVTAVVTAGIAAMQALAFLDGDLPAAIDGTLELRPPDWRLRRRTWPSHPDCDCGGFPAARSDGPEEVGGPDHAGPGPAGSGLDNS